MEFGQSIARIDRDSLDKIVYRSEYVSFALPERDKLSGTKIKLALPENLAKIATSKNSCNIG